MDKESLFRESILKQIEGILTQSKLKHTKIESEDISGFELVFGKDTETKDIEKDIEVALYINKKPDKLTMFVSDLMSTKGITKDQRIKILEVINKINSENILYGSLGIAERMNCVIYSNAISLEGRTSIEDLELLDYIVYSVFISQKFREEVKESLSKETLKVK